MKSALPLFQKIFTAVFAFSLITTSFAAGGIGGYPLTPLDSDNPNWFMYNLDRGETYEDTMVVKNGTDKEWIVDIYPADGAISSGGGFTVKQKSEEMDSIGTWITLEKEEVRLAPGESEQVGFSITIPENANVGETAGGIMFEKRDPAELSEEEGGGGIKLSIRTGVRVYNTVPGDIKEELVLEAFNAELVKKDGGKFIMLNTNLQNAGNVSSTAKYVITVVDSFSGATVDSRESDFIIGPETSFENNQEIGGLPRFGNLQVKVDMFLKHKDGTEKLVASQEASMMVLPVMEILAVLVFLIAAGTVWFVRAQKYSGKGWDEYAVKDGDDLMKLAAKHNIDWEILAKTNKIKPPYFLMKGMTIKVPPQANK